MLIFNCTKAALGFFTVTRNGKKQTIVEAPPSKDMSEDALHLKYIKGLPAKPQQWLLHAITLKGKHCLIAIEVDTRLCIIAPSVEKADVVSFLGRFMEALVSEVGGRGLGYGIWDDAAADVILERCFDHLDEIQFFKRYDRSVQTQMTEVARLLSYKVDDDPDVLTDEAILQSYMKYTNDTRRKSQAFPDKNSIFPIEEMLIYWQREYQGANPQQLTNTREVLADIRESENLEMLERLKEFFSQEVREELPSLPEDPGIITSEGGPLSSAEMDFLDDVVQQHATEESVANISGLHGFLTAIVSGPNSLPSIYWFPAIWGDDDSQPDWDSDEDELQFMELVFRLMDDISDILTNNPQDYAPLFTDYEDYTSVTDWCYGYMGGVDLDESSWEGLPTDLFDQVTFLDQHSFLINEDINISLRECRELNEKVVGIAQNLYAHWSKQRSTSRRPDYPFGVGALPQKPVIVGAKTGRNEPCPCGSGKKFKKCCLN
uniref:DUF6933 domain-containing protein n=1 Tax=uncultured Thiotrichaceae bacterium TaxID=298394 RepID=A0A6S6SMX6_9GAMM|nr:MAG: Unknown protein [uncultured Thiotrichaceae bacterium]